MNINEINSGTPRWWAVLITGGSLIAITIIAPLSFERFLRLVLRLWKSRLFKLLCYLICVVPPLGIWAHAMHHPLSTDPRYLKLAAVITTGLYCAIRAFFVDHPLEPIVLVVGLPYTFITALCTAFSTGTGSLGPCLFLPLPVFLVSPVLSLIGF